MSPFWADLDNRDPGNGGVHYQLYSSDNLPILSDISQAARASGAVDSTYSAEFALVVTWDRMIYFEDTARVSLYCYMSDKCALHATHTCLVIIIGESISFILYYLS